MSPSGARPQPTVVTNATSVGARAATVMLAVGGRYTAVARSVEHRAALRRFTVEDDIAFQEHERGFVISRRGEAPRLARSERADVERDTCAPVAHTGWRR